MPRDERAPRVRARHYEQPADVVDQMVNKYGTRDRAIQELHRDNYKLREKLREIARENETEKSDESVR